MRNSKNINIIIIGESNVGKTSIIRHLIGNQFKSNSVPTVGIDYFLKSYDRMGNQFNVSIWDSAGQERYYALSSNFIKKAEGIFIVFDITNNESFKKVISWKEKIDEKKIRDIIPIVLIGNKSDLTDERVVNSEEAKALADQLEIKYIETSAQTGENIEQSFNELVEMVIDCRNKRLERSMSQNGKFGLSKENEKKECIC